MDGKHTHTYYRAWDTLGALLLRGIYTYIRGLPLGGNTLPQSFTKISSFFQVNNVMFLDMHIIYLCYLDI